MRGSGGGAAGGKRGFEGRAPDAETIFTVYSQKIRIFKHIFA